jgi:exodeoxyribonuclease III
MPKTTKSASKAPKTIRVKSAASAAKRSKSKSSGGASGPLKIATFNTNSIRVRMGILLDWLKKEKPDVLAVQETKVQDHEFPREPLEAAGWNVVFHGQKSYNGVAFISKKPVEKVDVGFYKKPDEQARFITCEYEGVRLFNTYIPQGFDIESDKYQYKLKYLADLRKYFEKNVPNSMPALWMGDLNVARTEIDLNNPKGNRDHPCFHIDARNALEEVLKGKWTDLFREKEKGPGHYTFWDMRQPATFERNLGWRIDLILGTPPMVERLQKIWIDTKPRGLEKPSDHTFLIAEFSR